MLQMDLISKKILLRISDIRNVTSWTTSCACPRPVSAGGHLQGLGWGGRRLLGPRLRPRLAAGRGAELDVAVPAAVLLRYDYHSLNVLMSEGIKLSKVLFQWFDVCDSRSKYHKWKKVKCAVIRDTWSGPHSPLLRGPEQRDADGAVTGLWMLSYDFQCLKSEE